MSNVRPPHEDFSVSSFPQMPQVRRSKEGELEVLPLDLATLSQRKPKLSLSKDHLSLREVCRNSGKAGTDQLSDDPQWEPLVDSLLQPGSMTEDASSDIEKVGDLIPSTRLSDTCRNSWCLGEWQGNLDGAKFTGSCWLWDDKGDVERDETEGTDEGNFAGDG